MAWTNVPKPVITPSKGQPIANGFFLYLTYATSSSSWTDITKPTGTPWTDVPKPTGGTSFTVNPGNPIGLLLALTYADSSSVTSDPWHKVSKPL